MEIELPLARYRVRFSDSEWHQNRHYLQSSYLGSAWRGSFGSALRKAVCVTHLSVCDSCMLLDSCVFPWLFESRTPSDARKLTRYPRTPGPFVLEPADCKYDNETDTLNLGVVLFGRANDQLPFVVHALESAARKGLTSRSIRLELKDLQVEEGAINTTKLRDDQSAGVKMKPIDLTLESNSCQNNRNGWSTIYVPGDHIFPVPPRHRLIPPCPQIVYVQLLTPLRMRRNNRLVNAESFDIRNFSSVLVRRISLLTTFFCRTPLETDFAELLQQAEALTLLDRELRWQEWARYSSRQRSKIKMGGLLGWFSLEGRTLESIWPYLWLGQWTHVGRGCSMGLGRYVLELSKDMNADRIGECPRALHWPSPLKL